MPHDEHCRPLRTNLVRVSDLFVGREAELDALAVGHARGQRLLTLWGPAGMGKTRLAVEHAWRHGEAFAPPGGVWFCDLTEARSAVDVCAAVAAVLP